jgi:hypothetical protein
MVVCLSGKGHFRRPGRGTLRIGQGKGSELGTPPEADMLPIHLVRTITLERDGQVAL